MKKKLTIYQDRVCRANPQADPSNHAAFLNEPEIIGSQESHSSNHLLALGQDSRDARVQSLQAEEGGFGKEKTSVGSPQAEEDIHKQCQQNFLTVCTV